jgi:predicted MFS family arabinose efflux permease
MSPANRSFPSAGDRACADGDADEPDPPGAPRDRRSRPALITRPFVRLLAMQAASGFALSVFFLLPKVLASAFGSTPGEIGVVMAALGIASVLCVPIVGRVVDLLGQRGALTAANVVMAVSALGFVAVDRAGPLAFVLRGLHGVAWSLTFAAGVAMAADLVPQARLAEAVGLFGAASLATNAVAPAIAEPVGEHFGYRAMFVLAGASALLGTLLSRRLPSRPGPGRRAPLAAGAPPTGVRRGRAYLLLGVVGLAFGVMFTFIGPFALERGIHAVRGFFAAYTVAALAVRLGAARVSDRLGHERVVRAAGALYGVVVIAAGVLGPAPLLLLGAGFGAAHGALFPALMAMLMSDASGRARARVLGLANGVMNLGLTLVCALGLVAGRAGYPLVFGLAGALTVGVASLIGRAPRAIIVDSRA